MEDYTVKIEGEFIEGVRANNEEEALQLAIRLINLTIGNGGPVFTVAKTTICDSPKQAKSKKEGSNKDG